MSRALLLSAVMATAMAGCASTASPQSTQARTLQVAPGLELPEYQMAVLESEPLPNLHDHGDRWILAPGKVGYQIVAVDGQYTYAYQRLILKPGEHRLVLFFQGGLVPDGTVFPSGMVIVEFTAGGGQHYHLAHAPNAANPSPQVIQNSTGKNVARPAKMTPVSDPI